MEEKRRPGLLGYFTLALMTTTIVVCVLSMLILKTSSLALMLGTLPVLMVIDWMGHRLELSMAEHLPKRLWDSLMRLLIWVAAVMVLWARYRYGALTPDFGLLLLVIVQALTVLMRVIHAMGGLRAEQEPLPEAETKSEKKPEPKPEAKKEAASSGEPSAAEKQKAEQKVEQILQAQQNPAQK